MWKWLCVFSSVMLQIISGKLVGDHICRTEESYTVNVTEHYVKNATVRNYKWCLNVPPRCSYYTIKKISDTRIAERIKTRLIEKCCPGFVEKNHHCILSNCDSCQNGICNEGTCHCTSGFGGINCDTRCSLNFWGPNCTYVCNCSSESCNPIDGSCLPNTYKHLHRDGNDTTTLKTHTNEFHEEKFSIETTEIVSVNTAYIKEWYDNNVNSSPNNRDGSYFFSNSSSTETEPFTTTIYSTLPADHAASEGDNLTLDTYQTQIEYIDSFRKTKSKAQENPNIRHNLVNNNGDLVIPVGIQYDQIAKPLMQETTTPAATLEEKNYLGQDSISNTSKVPSKEYSFINSISVSAATTVALILLALVIVTIKRKYKPKQKMCNKKKDVSTVAVYTKSIFHTPLPDPPTCENPSYLSSMECQNCLTEPTVKTCLIYNTNRSNQIKSDFKNYEYDYPPSSGSYRAASIIEPLDADANQGSISVQTEPVYDEIPCRGDFETEKIPSENEPVSLYMNTCGFTNLK